MRPWSRPDFPIRLTGGGAGLVMVGLLVARPDWPVLELVLVAPLGFLALACFAYAAIGRGRTRKHARQLFWGGVLLGVLALHLGLALRTEQELPILATAPVMSLAWWRLRAAERAAREQAGRRGDGT